MRSIAFVLAALTVSGPAAAEWKEFTDVIEGFGVTFPADPKEEDVPKFEVVPGKTVPAHLYSAHYDNSVFKVTVVEGCDAGLEETPVIDQAIKRLTQGGELKANLPHRVWQIYGRQLIVAHPDGSLTKAAMFFVNDRLYEIEGTTFAGGSDADLIRFQQSLVFDRNVSNRTPQQIQAIRTACQGILASVGARARGGRPSVRQGNAQTEPGFSVAEEGNNAMPAGLDDPRCVQR